jgi:hypothetical protein
MYSTDKICSDLDIQTLESIPSTAPHRKVDLAILDASSEGICFDGCVLLSPLTFESYS